MIVKDTINIFFVLSLIVNAGLFIPQALRLIKFKNSEELSVITFFGFWLINISIVLHALITKDLLLFWGTMLSVITSGVVAWLILYYRYILKKK